MQESELTVTIRQASDVIFAVPVHEIPASNIHELMRLNLFTPFTKVEQGSKRGCKLDTADLTLLSVFRALFKAGIRHSLTKQISLRDTGLIGYDHHVTERARLAGRGPQAYFEQLDYHVFVRATPLATIAELIVFDHISNLQREVERYVQAQSRRGGTRLNLEPQTFVNVLNHYRFIQSRLEKLSKG